MSSLDQVQEINRYNSALVKDRVARILKGRPLEDVLRPEYMRGIIECFDVMDIEYLVTALSLLGRVLQQATKDYFLALVTNKRAFAVNSQRLPFASIKERLTGECSLQEDILNLLVQKEVTLSDGAKLKLKRKLLNDEDYNTLLYISKAKNWTFNLCDESVFSQIEERAESYIDLGLISLVKMVQKMDEVAPAATINNCEQALDINSQEVSNQADPQIYDQICKSMVVLECQESFKQGTAFLLEGYGFVTCDHVIGPNTQAFITEQFNTKYPIRVIAREPAIDLAIIEIPDLIKIPPLRPLFDKVHNRMDSVLIAGFPKYRDNDPGRVVIGSIATFRTVSTIRRIITDGYIIAGNSGGPVLSPDGTSVIGVAVTGVDKMEDIQDTENYGVIPIDAIKHLTPGDL